MTVPDNPTTPDPKTSARFIAGRAYLVNHEVGMWSRWANTTGDPELIALVARLHEALKSVRSRAAVVEDEL